jgi:phospholipid N-methyltransferase
VLGLRRPKDSIAERALFLRSFLEHPRLVGAVLPTSRRAVRDMLDLAPVQHARRVVELGAGTGVYTREILARLRPDGSLLALEIDDRMATELEARIRDPRLRVLAESAEHVEAHLDGERADVIVSGLPFTSLPAPVRDAVLAASRRALAPDGTMLVLQYSPFIEAALRRTFGSVTRRVSPLNVPPAFLFACRATAPTAR